MTISPASGHSSPAMIRSSVDLPEPLGPRSAVSDPLGDVERDVVDRGEVAEALRDAAHLDGHSAPLPRAGLITVMATRTSIATRARTIEIA